MYASDEGLVVAGEIDRDTAEGKQVEDGERWHRRLPIGYLAESKARKGGGRTITEVALLEVSITATPVHQSTRTLGWKSRPPIQIASFEC